MTSWAPFEPAIGPPCGYRGSSWLQGPRGETFLGARLALIGGPPGPPPTFSGMIAPLLEGRGPPLGSGGLNVQSEKP